MTAPPDIVEAGDFDMPFDADANLWPIWRRAARLPTVDAALRAIYDDLAKAVEHRGAQCWLSGRCCHFDAFGHRLYVTALEIAWVETYAGMPSTPVVRGEACPYQVKHQCSIHATRPLGCRIFFCQEGTEAWQQDLYETKLDALRDLHERFDIPYRYLEWLEGLEEYAMQTRAFETDQDDAR